ncbi:hypothetical protein ScPMuIL_006563, partial [Solemya velum]
KRDHQLWCDFSRVLLRRETKRVICHMELEFCSARIENMHICGIMKKRAWCCCICVLGTILLMILFQTICDSNAITLYASWLNTKFYPKLHSITHNATGHQNITSRRSYTSEKSYNVSAFATCYNTTRPTEVEDLLCMTPPSFLPGYRNPCWYELEGKLRCLPYFHVIGMDKSASTDLFDRICQHPSVLQNSGVLKKETMWWSWLRYGHWLQSSRQKESFSRYLKYFDNATKQIENITDAAGNHILVTGDGTPMDFWDFSGWPLIPQNRGLTEPKILTPHLIRHINPNVKLFLILRDPVDRLYSDYFFLGLGPQSVQGFSDSVDLSLQLLDRCIKEKSLRLCIFNRGIHLKMKARLHLGFYSIFLKEWLAVFPREQLLIFRTEDFSKDISSHIELAFNFLDLKPLSSDEMKIIAQAPHKYETVRKRRMKPMPSDTRQKLVALYKDTKEELAHMLQDNRFLWQT